MSAWNPTRRVWGSGESGFTLVEFLVVAMILILLAAIPLPIIMGATERAREARSSTELRTIEQALDLYYERLGHYPQSLGKLVQDGYLKQTSFESPWSSAENKIYFFYAVDYPGEGQAKVYALGDPGPKARCGKTWGQEDAVFSSDLAAPLPCGRKPTGTKAAYILGANLDNDMPLLERRSIPDSKPEYVAIYFSPPTLAGIRLDVRTNR